MDIDQLALRSVQPGYLKNLQWATLTQATQKQEKNTRSNPKYNTQAICFWKFGPQCPTSPLLPPRKVPLEDFDGYSTSTNTHPHKQHLYGPLAPTKAFNRYADVITTDTSSCAPADFLFLSNSNADLSPVDMLTSSLLNPDFSSLQIHQLISRFLSISNADVIVAAPMLTSSLLLVATSSRHADVIIAESRFLFASNPSDHALSNTRVKCWRSGGSGSRSRGRSGSFKNCPGNAPGSDQNHKETCTSRYAAVDLLIRSMTGYRTPSSVCTRRAEELKRTESPHRRDRNKSNHVSTGGGRRHDGRRATRGGRRPWERE
ncbi:putative WRKY transcription factor 65 [Dorcoceras hygrometricum]|uniref:Putative WRKY transcription factor 65 n=1 Tax=Dorcoceras hygrometricum TaxID=472368 RepID=A0A2Z7DB28_9LAMI|nr:putative WRKY transcription factor 65 [Dorcoceras hygrometricum]